MYLYLIIGISFVSIRITRKLFNIRRLHKITLDTFDDFRISHCKVAHFITRETSDTDRIIWLFSAVSVYALC